MRIALVRHPIDVAAMITEAAGDETGATTVFVGTVRNHNDGSDVVGIDYSAFEPMAERELRDIATAAGQTFGTDHIIIEHRLGTLGVGEASVVIVVAHPRRGPALDASRYVIEELKKRVPIWKREHYADGRRVWVDPTGATQAAPA